MAVRRQKAAYQLKKHDKILVDGVIVEVTDMPFVTENGTIEIPLGNDKFIRRAPKAKVQLS